MKVSAKSVLKADYLINYPKSRSLERNRFAVFVPNFAVVVADLADVEVGERYGNSVKNSVKFVYETRN